MIDEMAEGSGLDLRALDVEVAVKVMGLEPRPVRIRGSDETVEIYTNNPFYCDGQCDRHELSRVMAPPEYSKYIAAAWSVVEGLAAKDWRLTLMAPGGFTDEGLGGGDPATGSWSAAFKKPGDEYDCEVGYATGKTAPLAICLAAMKAVSP
jgi:hypothetical protein